VHRVLVGWPEGRRLSPQDRTHVQTGAALGVKPGARTIIMPLTVWAAPPRAAVVPRGCEEQDVTRTCPVALTGNINFIKQNK
jgi:hypothetical protein